MSSRIDYAVTLSPAEITDGCVSHMLFDPREVKTTVTAYSLTEMQAIVRQEAARHFPTDHVAAYVSLPRGLRKPNGFDAATRAVQTIRNDRAA